MHRLTVVTLNILSLQRVFAAVGDQVTYDSDGYPVLPNGPTNLDNSTTGATSFHTVSYPYERFKHDPFITIVGTTATVGVAGDDGITESGYLHPQTDSHYITDIWVVDQTDTVVFQQSFTDADSEALATFQVPSSATSFVAYEFCNIHGLYRGPVVNVEWPGLYTTLDNATSGATSVHQASTPPIKHDPFIENSCDSSNYRVGVRGTDGTTVAGDLHPQTDEHHITYIWIKDNSGSLLHTCELYDADATAAECNVPRSLIPDDSTIQATQYCNLHGLYTGPSHATCNAVPVLSAAVPIHAISALVMSVCVGLLSL